MYGYWIDKEGNFIEVEEHLGHDKVICYEQAFDENLIALATQHRDNHLFFRFYGIPSLKIISSLISYIRSHDYETYSYDLPFPEFIIIDAKSFHSQNNDKKRCLIMLNKIKLMIIEADKRLDKGYSTFEFKKYFKKED